MVTVSDANLCHVCSHPLTNDQRLRRVSTRDATPKCTPLVNLAGDQQRNPFTIYPPKRQ